MIKKYPKFKVFNPSIKLEPFVTINMQKQK